MAWYVPTSETVYVQRRQKKLVKT